VLRSVIPESRSPNEPQLALLLACARVHLEPGHSVQVRSLLGQEIDWPSLIGLAQRQKVLPLLYRGLCPHRDLVPRAVMHELRAGFRANAVQSLSRTQELFGVLQVLGTADVLAAAYRGPVLALEAYGDLALRQFDDLDILLRLQDVDRATERLISLGYRLQRQRVVDDDLYARSMHHHAFVGRSRTLLEVHWQLTERYFGFTLDPEIWQRLKPINLAGIQVFTLSPEDLLLAICVHSSKHAWARLQWICDVAEVARSGANLDWEQVWWRAQRSGAGRMLLLGLALASDLLGTVLPEAFQTRVRTDRQLPSLVAEMKQGLQGESEGSSDDSGRMGRFGLHLRLRQTAWAKARHCLRVALIPSQEDWEFLQLPARLYPLYYVARPMRLLRKHLARSVRRHSVRPML
jgi:hypothetical protein